MPRKTPAWREKLPLFLEAIDCAENEDQIHQACAEIKQAVVECFPDTPNSRKTPMKEIRIAIREKYQPQKGKSPHEAAPFPWYFTNSEKGRIERWEHLAIKHLSAEWNKKSDTLTPAPSTETSIDIFTEVGLEGEELAVVKQARGDADINEWVKQALLQRAKAINALHERLNEDLSMVPSDELMNDKRYRTNPNASRELASRAVRAIKHWNYSQPEHKWCITNKLISELTGVTPKAIAKVVEGMGIEDYNAMQGLTPVVNRQIKAAVGTISEVVNIADMLGID
ncbi:MAG: hypothetical protein F6K41_11050 [Symploca sp. SIO3E6]|nr:hypothetical protein [Caldora sp. SIO3E6]